MMCVVIIASSITQHYLDYDSLYIVIITWIITVYMIYYTHTTLLNNYLDYLLNNYLDCYCVYIYYTYKT